jgi:hypothetical protein
MGPIGCDAMSVRHCHSTLRKIPKVRRFHLRRESKPEVRFDFLVVDRNELCVKNSSNKIVTVLIIVQKKLHIWTVSFTRTETLSVNLRQ